jgi:hypothetical protein
MSELDKAAMRALLDAHWFYLDSAWAPWKCLDVAAARESAYVSVSRAAIYDTAMLALSLHLDVPTHRVWDAIHWPAHQRGAAFSRAAKVLDGTR